jgi:hypothetical protein
MNVIINKSISKNKMTLICILGIIVSLVVAYTAIKPYVDTSILKIATKTEATITENTYIEGSPDKQTTYAVKIDYVANGKKFKRTATTFGKIIKYNIGDKVDVYYQNSNPSKVEIYHISYLALGFSMLLLAGMILIMNKNFKRS